MRPRTMAIIIGETDPDRSRITQDGRIASISWKHHVHLYMATDTGDGSWLVESQCERLLPDGTMTRNRTQDLISAERMIPTFGTQFTMDGCDL